MKKEILYTCMGCGFKVFKGVFSEYEICSICKYIDGSGSISHPLYTHNPHSQSLTEYQKINIKKYPDNILEFKFGNKIYYRNPLWKPIDENKLDNNHEYLPKWKYQEFLDSYGDNTAYKQSYIESQKFNPDEKVHLKSY